MPTLQERYSMKVNSWIVYREIAGEYLLLDLRSESRKYCKYSGVMAEVFTLILGKDSLEQVIDDLCEKYDESSRNDIEKDVHRIFSKLACDGVLQTDQLSV